MTNTRYSLTVITACATALLLAHIGLKTANEVSDMLQRIGGL